METIEFLGRILPTAGLRCAVGIGSNRRPKQVFGPSDDWLYNTCKQVDAHGANAYHGCAGFKDGSSRKAENVEAVRSFWVDLDVGDDPKKYPSIKLAATHVMEFCQDIGLPAPLVVRSGNGLHCYWPMDADMAPAEWLPVASSLKQVAKGYGLKADPSRTADIASILRPPGTHHRKGEPRLVRVVLEGEVGTLAAFQAALDRQQIGSPRTRRPTASTSINDDLTAGQDFPPSSGAKIAGECAVLALMRDTRGDVDQPTWYHSLGVLAFTEEGAALCHEWSDGHPAYSPDETDRKIAQVLKFAPTTCAKLSETQPELCQTCPHLGRIASPIVLGFEAAAVTQVAPEPDGDSAEPEPLTLPDNYRCINVKGRNILQWMAVKADPDGNEVVQWESFCDTLFYPVTRIDHGGEQGHEMEMEMLLRNNRRRRFKVPHGVIGKGGNDLLEILGRHEIMPYSSKQRLLHAYLADWARDLRESVDSVKSFNQFGWHDDGFLIGDTLLTPKGETHAILKEGALDHERSFGPAGDLETWKSLVDRAYNYAGQESLQFMVLCSFAAPLFSLFKDYGGVTVYAHSEGSGVGKTTAQRVGLSAWGDWYHLQLAEGKVTPNYLWTALGTSGTIPVLLDELTNLSTNMASELVYSMSSGRNKKRLTRSGRAQQNTPNWSTILLTSGNNLLSEKLAQHRGNPEAELSRLFEFTVDGKSRLSPNEAAELFPQFRDHYGHAGRIYAQYLVDNKEMVVQLLHALRDRFNHDVDAAQRERFWSALHASVLGALTICRKLDLVRFNPQRLMRWIRSQITSNRMQGRSVTPGAKVQFGEMLGDLLPGILITEGTGDARRNAFARVLVEPRTRLIGRVIDGSQVEEVSVMYIAASAAREWCNKRGISSVSMREAGVKGGWIKEKNVRFALGKGSQKYSSASGQQLCWVIDPELAGVTDALGSDTDEETNDD